ncbi:cytotoxic translational repressor of toxin-antitoxin stability system [Cylindrospermum stagnale PCC 7417]|uniref:Cytotoxic translational repressor of toxin-antitoxin stability system n=1 Tax=Cylindrospermum stagnale PCC 7417 TaxID=56107 RepID=K9X152_9NOST|nr:cytotoxic translational repressor of toxin-antitoxin stability system [Cylindrospermum stagnale PCC 7417]
MCVHSLPSAVNSCLLQKIKSVIEEVENAVSLGEINNVKKLKADGDYYRIRVGDYRIGIAVSGDVVIFMRILHRREVYRYFR